LFMASHLDSFVEGLLTPMVNFVILSSSNICYISHFIIMVKVVLSLFLVAMLIHNCMLTLYVGCTLLLKLIL
jgi:hypothetical protein